MAAAVAQLPKATSSNALQTASARSCPLPGPDNRLRVTVLSGFLGSGKTTLLTNILKSKQHGLKIAVIVNDMAAINVDGQHFRNFDPRARDNKTIEFQNGCICCTLRGDLLAELGRLALGEHNGARGRKFDYVIIESSGVSEPMNVAETFALEFSDVMDENAELSKRDRKMIKRIANKGGLNKIAKIDTMVTVIDSHRLMNDFFTSEMLAERWSEKGYVPDEDNRTIPDLLVDQIEFANVIVINKTDLVDEETLARSSALLKVLNPHAKQIRTSRGVVPVNEVVGTGIFDYEDAQALPGWLLSLHELNTMKLQNGETRLTQKPETLEYGIGSFVYEARRPFHPERLYYAIKGKFVLFQGVMEGDDDGEEEEGGDKGDDDGDDAMEDAGSDSEEEASDAVPDEIAVRNHKEDPVFSSLHRSKGTLWLASRPFVKGAWSSAGAVLSIQTDMHTWFSCYPEGHPMNVDEIGKDPERAEIADRIRADMDSKWGDRRQEIVIIGENIGLLEKEMTALFDSCLLDDEEWAEWERIMSQSISDEKKVEELEEKWEGSWWVDWFVPDDDDDDDDDVEMEDEDVKGKRPSQPERHSHPHQGHSHHHHRK